jgi:hypothetical protein
MWNSFQQFIQLTCYMGMFIPHIKNKGVVVCTTINNRVFYLLSLFNSSFLVINFLL